MASVLQFWKSNREFLAEKGVQQIIALCGDGKLRDASSTSSEFRDLLDILPSRLLGRYAEECLESPFENSGFALQDIINQLGVRLGFQVTNGLYQGKVNQIGFDGIWTAPDGYHLIIEVKTTDSYRINLDTLATYRMKLVEHGQVATQKSSILIVVGRRDTGDLEAQIRGSRHAWDIRLLSVDALLKLAFLKEGLTDAATVQKIYEILKPLEYTRLDRIVDVMFSTSEDIQTEAAVEETLQTEAAAENFLPTQAIKESQTERGEPSKFYEGCVDKIAKVLGTPLVKQGRTLYQSADRKQRVSCAVSKAYPGAHETTYWYAYHPSQSNFLSKSEQAFVGFGCGSPDTVVLIPFTEFEQYTENMLTTSKAGRHYWHVKIFDRDGKLFLGQPKSNERLDISKFRLS